MQTINEGFSGNYIVHGVFSIILGFVSLAFWSPLIFVLFALAITFFCAQNGIQIDKNRYRKYGSFFGWKIGIWKSVESPLKVRLIISTENGTYLTTTAMGSYGIGAIRSTKALTYNLILKDENSKESTIYEFRKYRDARKTLGTIPKEWNVETFDKIQAQLEKRRRR